jgi:serine/threonine protein kinase
MSANECEIGNLEDGEEGKQEKLQVLTKTRFSTLYICDDRQCADDDSNGGFILKRVNSSKSEQMLKNEFLLLQYLAHQGNSSIIQPIRMTTYDNKLALQLPYIRAETLKKHVQSGDFLSENLIKLIFLHLADTLGFLHRLGIVHRDIKPENVLYSPETQKIKLIDFGLAQQYKKREPVNKVCGSLHYIAPELIAQKPFACLKKVDIWALGVLLYFLVYKDRPFTADCSGKKKKRNAQVFRKIQNEKLVHKSERREKATKRPVSENLKEIIDLILEKDPDKRISITDIIDHPLFKTI